MIKFDKKFYSVKEASELLGITAITLRKFVREGRLVAYNFGGERTSTWTISIEALEKFLTDSQVDTLTKTD
jgi:excisionase family DNA binding protein